MTPPEKQIYRTGEIIGPGTYRSIKSGKVIHKDKVGPIPPSGDEIEYEKLSDDPYYQMSEKEREERKPHETSHEEPAETTAKTGEIVSPGVWECTKCHYRLEFDEPGHIPPCPRDANTSFVKVK